MKFLSFLFLSLKDDLDNDEKSLLESTQELLKSPDSSKSTTPETQAPAKKVSLKRNIIVTPLIIEQKTESLEKTEDDSEVLSADEPEKKVIKISELSAKDRLEMRAKKFGAIAASSTTTVGLPSKIKLDARAARFGISAAASAETTETSSSTNSITAPVSDEVLKKRAERFGAISEIVKKTEFEEKKVKRVERFGGEGKVPITGPASDDATKTDYAEKARLRLERFKQTA